VEYDSAAIVASTRLLLERLTQQLSKKQRKKITAAGVIAQRSSLIACYKNTGQAITSMISWQDTRNAEWLTQQALDYQYLHALTGLRFNAHAGASKMRWLLENNAAVQAQAEKENLLFVPWGAWFLQQLLADKKNLVTDPILAARTGLTSYGELQWSPDLLQLFTIPEHSLPPIVASTYHYGELAFGEQLIPVRLLGGDQNFIPCAYGTALMKQSAFFNLGSGAFIQSYTATANKDALLSTAIAIEKNQPPAIITEGTINAAATALDWWQTQLPRPFSFAEIDQLLANTQTAPLFINTLAGTGSPWWLPQKPPVFINAEEKSNAEKTVAVIESILFAAKSNLNQILLLNNTIEQIIISGGLARLDNLCQKLADLTELIVVRYTDSEASARGAAFYLTQKKKYKPTQEPAMFTPQAQPLLTERFEQYSQAIKSLDTSS
jgi:glycerol kinase